ncbi:MAG: FMN-binding protein [Treponema sp.]|nr:FMN-binding protein [Treponema sp.]
MKYIIKPAATLLITAVITVAALSIVYNLTLEPIERQARRTQEKAMMEVMLLPGGTFEKLERSDWGIENSGNIVSIHRALYLTQLYGYVVQLSPEGYSGKIDLVVGISIHPFEKINGLRVLRHSETPGLGALATEESFYQQFTARDLVALGVAKASAGMHDIQAITSSTITTKAITGAVNEAIEWYLTVRKPSKQEFITEAEAEDEIF